MKLKVSDAPDVISERPYLFLGSRLKRLAEHLQGEVTAASREIGLPLQPGQTPLLLVLAEQGAKSIGELASSLRLSQPAITKQASKLVAAGLVAIDRENLDKRQRTVSLTQEGHAIIERSKHLAWPLVEAAVKELTEGLTGPLFDQLTAIEERLAVQGLARRMHTLQRGTLSPAKDTEVPAIVSLMNRAYRGTSGWTSEFGYIEGDRTSETDMRAALTDKPDAALLVWRRAAGDLQGCVWLEPLGDSRWYLGSLTVEPLMQNSGLGRRLLTAAEEWAAQHGGSEIKLTVVNVRDTLIAWYLRRGYQLSGESEAFPYGDTRFGTPTRSDLCFMVLRKPLPARNKD